jgi:putative flippase GtrA
MRQLIRYGFVGVLSNAIIFCIYLFLTYLGIAPKASMTFLYAVGASIGFVGHRRWTFLHLGDARNSAQLYLLAHLLGYTLNFLIIFIFVDRFGFDHKWVQAFAVLVVALLLFIVLKYYVFRKEPSA